MGSDWDGCIGSGVELAPLWWERKRERERGGAEREREREGEGGREKVEREREREMSRHGRRGRQRDIW